MGIKSFEPRTTLGSGFKLWDGLAQNFIHELRNDDIDCTTLRRVK